MKGVLLIIISIAWALGMIWMRLRSGKISPNSLLLFKAYQMIGAEPPESLHPRKQTA